MLNMPSNKSLKPPAKLKNILIIGIGLIGSSLALAIRKNNLAETIYIYDSNLKNSELAIENNIGDAVYNSFDESLKQFDVIFFCTPLSAYYYICEKIIENITANTIVTDVGSVKQNPLEEIYKIYDLNKKSYLKKYFVPTHPIAGTENSGPLAGFDSLFKNKRLIITHSSETNSASVEKIASLWGAIGSDVIHMEAGKHDEIYAKVSHIVQLVCSSFVSFLMKKKAELGDINLYFFKDFVRVAGSDAKMWTDIFLYNKENIITAIDLFLEKLSQQDFDGAINLRKKIVVDENYSPILCAAQNRYLIPIAISCGLVNLIDEDIIKYAIGAGLISMTKNLTLYDECNDFLKIDLGAYVNEVIYFKKLIEKEDDITLMNHLNSIKNFYRNSIIG
jgi:prephenate dehydrogenase